MRHPRVIVVLFFVLASASAYAQARQLYWETLAVTAHLEADGRLEIEERQTMVFTGDWNGGERTFNIRPRQELTFHGMSRIDPISGVETPMVEGSLGRVDRWDWTDRHVLRWRAREEDDPPFNRNRITYVLRYTLAGILKPDGEAFLLDHDFAFPDRVGSIETFTLDLTFDPLWQPTREVQRTWSASGMRPGRSFVVRVPLRYTGESAPVVDAGIGPQVRRMLGALAAIPLLLLGFVFLREQMLGRFARLRVDQISRSWLEQNLLRERPEVIGTMWDGAVGAPEVAALLARLVAEGRIESNTESGQMELTLSSREGLNDYERALIDGLFFDGGTYTSTSMIKEHYKARGFSPSGIIAAGLQALVQERLPKGTPAKPSWLVPTLPFLAAVAALVFMVREHRDFLIGAIIGGVGALVVGAFMTVAPDYWRTRKSLGIGAALLTMLPASIVVAAVGYVIWRSAALGSPDLPYEVQLALAALALWIFATAAQALRSRESREAIAFRKMMGAAREYFRRELRKEHPALDDAWYPYVLAFGLDGDVARWFQSFPAAASSHDDRHSRFGSRVSSGSSFSSSGWTGGGGAFGGAGATGGWALAAGGMAAGVAAPSSSGSSGSSGGGRSGGGGGGGW
jgi:uncharacterized membrane protein YgcG